MTCFKVQKKRGCSISGNTLCVMLCLKSGPRYVGLLLVFKNVGHNEPHPEIVEGTSHFQVIHKGDQLIFGNVFGK